jgi:hypothetical protein
MLGDDFAACFIEFSTPLKDIACLKVEMIRASVLKQGAPIELATATQGTCVLVPLHTMVFVTDVIIEGSFQIKLWW